jgi:hypothetical protein
VTAGSVLIIGLLALGGFLVGGVVSLWPRHRVAAGICAVLAALAVAGAVLRLVSA